jgi:uncharacterized membrane protein (DUF485 family)
MDRKGSSRDVAVRSAADHKGQQYRGGPAQMSVEQGDFVGRVQSDPDFQNLVRRRARLAWLLSGLMVLIYFGFVLTIAYFPSLLARSLAGGVTTVGIPVGVAVILSAFILTGIYVMRANSTFDDLTKAIVDRQSP